MKIVDLLKKWLKPRNQKVARWLKKLLHTIDSVKAKGVIRNLESDKAINAETWKAFCKNLKAKHSNPRKKTLIEAEQIFMQSCNQYSLNGPDATIPEKIDTLYHVISEENFKNYFLSAARNPIAADESGIILEAFLKKNPDEQRESLKASILGKPDACVWAFFPEPQDNNSPPNPFTASPVSGNAENLREILGLECSVPKGSNLIGFRYPVTLPQTKKVPLAVSAGFNPCFKPSEEPSPPYGWTFNQKTNKNGVPEIVHENIAVEKISFPLEYILSTRLDQW